MNYAPEDPALQRLVSAAMEMVDQGLEPPIDEICRERPDLISAVQQSLELARRLPTIRREAAGRDGFLGRVLDGRYRLDARLGAGAMGVVYRASDLELHRDVAVKVLHSAILDADEAGYRFAREAEVMAAIRHPSVITVYDRGSTSEDEPYLVMELLDGLPLSEILDLGKRRGGAAPADDTGWIAHAIGAEALDEASYLRTVVRWTADLAGGLSAAHEAGVFHRDVKPSNVFVRRNGQPMLLDFGIAAHASQATITREGTSLGTPAYMAPESLDARAEPTAALDVYGLAATLYHMLTLRAPYGGTPSQIISSLQVKEPPPAYKLRPGLPRDLQAILDRGMARKPGGRYATAHDFEADLRAFLDYRPVSARPVTALARAWRGFRRSRALLAGTAVAVVALGIAGGLEWRSYRLAQRRSAHGDIWRHMYPNFTIVDFENRVCVTDVERAHVSGILDDAMAVAVEPLPAQLYRSSFRLDHGDPRGAAEDMAAIADWVDTRYARALAERYERLPDDASSARSVDLIDMPEPTDAMDVYLAAYHVARELRYSEAFAMLADERLERFGPAQELWLPTTPFSRKLSDAENLALADEMYERAVRLEEQIGYRTATTAHLIARALVQQESYNEALLVAREGIQLAPGSHTLRINAGLTAWRLGRFEEAEEHLGLAIEVRPKNARPYSSLARSRSELGDYEGALAVVDAAPYGTSAGARAMCLQLEGEIETARSLGLWQDGREERAVAAAELAQDRFKAAQDLGRDLEKVVEFAVSKRIVARETRQVFSDLLIVLPDSPIRWRILRALARWMPEDLSKAETALMKKYIQALTSNLSQRAEMGSLDRE
ncbi:MAG: protein kinase [bacterium]|nr:protein kinase [bacterium]